MPTVDRMKAWRDASGAPSTVTTRRPNAIFPGERPRSTASHSTGYPNSTSATPTTTAMTPAVPGTRSPTRMASAKRTAPWISVSISFATPRDARPASSKSSTTASGVTMPAGLRATASLRYRRARRPPFPAPSWTSTGSSPPTKRAGCGSSSSRRPQAERGSALSRWMSSCSCTSAPPPTCRTPGRIGPTLSSSPASRAWWPTRAACSTAPVLVRWAAFARFFTTSFPAAVWHARRFMVASAILLLVPAVLVGAWLARSDAALDASAPDALREAYVEDDFEAYYSSVPASQFATEVTVNNIQVGFLAFAVGILLCVPTAFILASNGANLGHRRGVVRRGRTAAEVLRPHPPPRPARAVRDRGRRCRRVGGGLGDRRPRRSARAPRRSPSRAAGQR